MCFNAVFSWAKDENVVSSISTARVRKRFIRLKIGDKLIRNWGIRKFDELLASSRELRASLPVIPSTIVIPV